jgi:hypothetical protein
MSGSMHDTQHVYRPHDYQFYAKIGVDKTITCVNKLTSTQTPDTKCFQINNTEVGNRKSFYIVIYKAIRKQK